jgi:hypothetical protein
MYTHSGVNLDFNLFHAGLSGDQWTHHDQIARSSLVDLGGGTSFAFTQSWQMFLTVAHSVAGRNGHLHAAVVTLGVSRSFGTTPTVERAFAASAGEAAPGIGPVVCTCSRTR